MTRDAEPRNAHCFARPWSSSFTGEVLRVFSGNTFIESRATATERLESGTSQQYAVLVLRRCGSSGKFL